MLRRALLLVEASGEMARFMAPLLAFMGRCLEAQARRRLAAQAGAAGRQAA